MKTSWLELFLIASGLAAGTVGYHLFSDSASWGADLHTIWMQCIAILAVGLFARKDSA